VLAEDHAASHTLCLPRDEQRAQRGPTDRKIFGLFMTGYSGAMRGAGYAGSRPLVLESLRLLSHVAC
jgi:hypothetical protein